MIPIATPCHLQYFLSKSLISARNQPVLLLSLNSLRPKTCGDGDALKLTKSGFIRIGTKVAEVNFKKKFPAEILKAINRKVGTTIVTKYGTKRGGVAIGKLIPFGVGSVIGGGFNYFTIKSFKKTTLSYLNTKIKGEP